MLLLSNFLSSVWDISLPQTVDELAHRIENFWSVLEGCTSVDDVRMARRFNPALKANLEGYTDEEVLSRRQSLSAGSAQAEAAADPRIAEFQLLGSGNLLIGANHPGAHLHAETLDRGNWDPDGNPALSGIMSLVAVHRLREVACLYGFTRFEPAPLARTRYVVGLPSCASAFSSSCLTPSASASSRGS